MPLAAWRIGDARGKRTIRLVEAAKRNSLYVRPYKYLFMFTPATQRNRYLMTVWRHGEGDELRVTFSAEAFSEFFVVSADQVREILGSDASQHTVATDVDAHEWEAKVDRFFAMIAASEELIDGEAG
jgi:hypothetical protein